MRYKKTDRIQKFSIGKNRIADISFDVIEVIKKHLQVDFMSAEAGGFLIGYENAKNYNITINFATQPQDEDERSRFSFIRRHKLPKLNNYTGYIGTWHTHPEPIPRPSFTDYKDWRNCIHINQRATDRLIFLIAGTLEYKLWMGDCIKNKIFGVTKWIK